MKGGLVKEKGRESSSTHWFTPKSPQQPWRDGASQRKEAGTPTTCLTWVAGSSGLAIVGCIPAVSSKLHCRWSGSGAASRALPHSTLLHQSSKEHLPLSHHTPRVPLPPQHLYNSNLSRTGNIPGLCATAPSFLQAVSPSSVRG